MLNTRNMLFAARVLLSYIIMLARSGMPSEMLYCDAWNPVSTTELPCLVKLPACDAFTAKDDAIINIITDAYTRIAKSGPDGSLTHLMNAKVKKGGY
jgi:hypothetical protein